VSVPVASNTAGAVVPEFVVMSIYVADKSQVPNS
jgi:hypothetical protein